MYPDCIKLNYDKLEAYHLERHTVIARTKDNFVEVKANASHDDITQVIMSLFDELTTIERTKLLKTLFTI